MAAGVLRVHMWTGTSSTVLSKNEKGPEMKGGLIATMMVVGLALGFAGGWFVAEVENADKLAPTQVWSDRWISDIMLLTGGGHRTSLMPPDKTQSLVASSLNADSLVLGRVYDRLSQKRKQQLMFYIPAARAIAAAQGSGRENNRRNLLILVDCLQRVKSQGGLVRSCVEAKHEKAVAQASPQRTRAYD